MACAPTAQPRRDPTIWMAPSAGTNVGSMPDGVGVALGESDGDGVGEGVSVGVAVGESLADGVSLADGDALALGVGVSLVADADVQPARMTAIKLVAPNRAR